MNQAQRSPPLSARIFGPDEPGHESRIRVWLSEIDHWTYNEKGGPEATLATPEMNAKWNEQMRVQILGLIAQKKRELVRRKLNTVSPKLSQLTTNIIPIVPGGMDQARYVFLAMRRNPADRRLLEELLQPRPLQERPNGWPPGIPWSGRGGDAILRDRNSPYAFKLVDFERIQADAYLAIFDHRPAHLKSTHLPIDIDEPLTYLGKLSGRVVLPLPILRRMGFLRIWLVPEKHAHEKNFPDSAELLEIEVLPRTTDPALAHKEYLFSFATVTPNTYLLKAVWDRRRQFEDRQQAGPGDYESPWVGPITITAGNTTSNIVAVCTNRSTFFGGEPYYAADEAFHRSSTVRQ